jgi:vacuolar-type H+-ATPase subunit H
MLKNNNLLFLSLIWISLCHTSADAPLASTPTPNTHEPTGGWSAALSNLLSNITSPATQKVLEEATYTAQNLIDTNLPMVEQKAKELLSSAEETGKNLIDHATKNAGEALDHSLEAAQKAIDYTGETIQNNLNGSTTHAATELTKHVIPTAEKSMQSFATHSAGEFKAILKPTMLACCWIGLAFFGAKLLYDGINDLGLNEAHKGKYTKRPKTKISIGAGFIALATFAIYKHFE